MNTFKLLVASASALALTAPAALAEWQPKKPVEFIIMAGTGGGAGLGFTTSVLGTAVPAAGG